MVHELIVDSSEIEIYSQSRLGTVFGCLYGAGPQSALFVTLFDVASNPSRLGRASGTIDESTRRFEISDIVSTAYSKIIHSSPQPNPYVAISVRGRRR